ncbi:GIY-YIG nuclease family protein [Pseudodesulfovibrio thermohalotolerans]|uniref:GIY-YIG nuclease family protein n=1 Tax=Pseudodesulfovibrio thermohalotolerans TaxID=2880651 RepID=UPI0022B9D55D|nr:GIY-YIG nuclease family protein [Pseudodesulfovibrio thermohalotolerans]WFS61158.1 GIY-YIG nuclease family protein [Pseudodesulfovibrio thermohalotolerans]
MQTWHVYLLRCADNSLYCGITNNLDRRLAAHNAGTASKYTRARLPVRLAASVTVDGKSAALRLEMAIKKMPAGQKIERLLATGEPILNS